MTTGKTIAFIHGVYFPDNARIDTMPFVLNFLRRIAEAGWNIDVYLWEQWNPSYLQMFPPNVSFKYQQSPVQSPAGAEMFRQGKGYDCVFGTGQMGAYVGALVAARNNSPLVLFNNEFPSQWGRTPFLQAEISASRQACLLVVPCPSRVAPLLQELSLPPDKPCVAIPNGPPMELELEGDDWKARLGVSDDVNICLNAGSISDFAQVPELMTTVPCWPENTVLVLNERNSRRLEAAQGNFSHLNCEGRIVWNQASLSEEDLHSLVAASSLGFALYRNSGPNIEFTGFSSGKLMRSIAASVPVIASHLSSFDFVEEHKLGKLVDHPMEIPDAISEIINSREEYAENCRTFYSTHCRFEPYWNRLCDELLEHSGTDLRIESGDSAYSQ